MLTVVLFVTLIGVLSSELRAATPSDVVTISPSKDIQAIVDTHLPGTSCLLLRGVLRGQSVMPKDGDSFAGEVGAHMSGAVILWPFVRRRNVWLEPAPRASANPTGKCAPNQQGKATDICTYLEDLFLDSESLRRVAAPDRLKPGT